LISNKKLNIFELFRKNGDPLYQIFYFLINQSERKKDYRKGRVQEIIGQKEW